MGLFSSGKKHKRAAEAYLRQANAIQDYQSEVEFRRQLLSNIRQERIARAQMQVRDYSPTYRSSTNEGFIANIDSSLAGEVDYSYSTSIRQQQMTDLVDAAQQEYKKYQKQTQRRATAFSVGGLVAGALTGGALGYVGVLGSGVGTMSGGIMGAQIGQGAGQIASNTGQWQTGIQNILSGGTGIYGLNQSERNYKRVIAALTGNYTDSYQTPAGYGRYEALSMHPKTQKLDMNSAEQFLLPEPNGTTFKGCGGYYR